MNDSFKTLLAFMGGIAAGAAIGILMAPDKGSETRKKILSRAKNLGDDFTGAAKDKYDDFVEWKNNLLSTAEDAVQQTINHNTSKAESKSRNA